MTFPIYGKIKHVPNHQPDPMVFLWFSYGFPMAFPDSPRRIPLRAQTDKLSRLRRCRFDAKVITDLEHLAARKGGARSMGHFPNCPVSLPEAIGKIPTIIMII